MPVCCKRETGLSTPTSPPAAAAAAAATAAAAAAAAFPACLSEGEEAVGQDGMTEGFGRVMRGGLWVLEQKVMCMAVHSFEAVKKFHTDRCKFSKMCSGVV